MGLSVQRMDSRPKGGSVTETAIFAWCRNFISYREGEGVSCAKQGNVPDCMHCKTCPKCGGRTRNDGEILDYHADHRVWLVFRKCANCSNQTDPVRMVQQLEEGRAQEDSRRRVCSVQDCGRGVYTHHSYRGYPICSTHHDQIYTWRRLQLPEKRFPLVQAGPLGLKENPAYRGRRRVGQTKQGGENGT